MVVNIIGILLILVPVNFLISLRIIETNAITNTETDKYNKMVFNLSPQNFRSSLF